MKRFKILFFFAFIKLSAVNKPFPLSRLGAKLIAVKFLNFGTPEISSVIYLKFKQRGQTERVFCQNGTNGLANSEYSDQEQSDLGLHCLPRPICPKT